MPNKLQTSCTWANRQQARDLGSGSGTVGRALSRRSFDREFAEVFIVLIETDQEACIPATCHTIVPETREVKSLELCSTFQTVL